MCRGGISLRSVFHSGLAITENHWPQFRAGSFVGAGKAMKGELRGTLDLEQPENLPPPHIPAVPGQRGKHTMAGPDRRMRDYGLE